MEIQQTSQEIVRLVQRQHFHEEYLCLKEGRQVKCNSKLANLSTILTDDGIRVGGRTHRAPIAFKAAHQMVLPKSHHVSMLIVRYYHYVLGYEGVIRPSSESLDPERKVSRALDPRQVCVLPQV